MIAVAVETRPDSGSSSSIATCQFLNMVFTTACYVFTLSSKELINPTVNFWSGESDHSSGEIRDSASAKAGTRNVAWPMSSILNSLGQILSLLISRLLALLVHPSSRETCTKLASIPEFQQ